MKPIRRYFIDSHPKVCINTPILWIIVGTGLLDKWLPRVATSWKAGETYNLPLSIAYVVIGVVVVVANFISVNSGVNRLVSRITTDPEPNEIERR